MRSTTSGNPACPYLGLEDDADTSLAFPSIWNTCHRGRRVVSPNLEHQGGYCLGENHRSCVAFSSDQATLPQHLRLLQTRVQTPRRNPYKSFTFVFTGILLLVGIGWGFSVRSYTPPANTEIPLLTMTALIPPAATHTASPTATPAFTMTAAPKAILTGEATLGRQLDQPIGSDYRFVIHKILYGENLNQCAARYDTSIDAILMVNYNFKTPVWVDELIVIPVGFTNVSDLPTFEAYEVPRANMSLKVLALSLGVSLKDLRYYNAIGMDESLQAGDWLLIPRPKQKP